MRRRVNRDSWPVGADKVEVENAGADDAGTDEAASDDAEADDTSTDEAAADDAGAHDDGVNVRIDDVEGVEAEAEDKRATTEAAGCASAAFAADTAPPLDADFHPVTAAARVRWPPMGPEASLSTLFSSSALFRSFSSCFALFCRFLSGISRPSGR